MIESITTVGGFERLGGEWRELQRHSASHSLFLTWEWLFTWWKHLSGSRRLMILVVRRENRVIGIAPFAIRPPSASRLLPFRALELLGTGSVGSDYLDLIIERGSESEALAEIVEHIATLRLPLELPQVLLDGSSARLLADSLNPRGWRATETNANSCPFIRLTGLDWPGYVATLGAAHRANLRRRMRGLQRIGELRFDAVHNDLERRDALAHLIELHNERWRTRGGSDAFNTRGMVMFHEEFSSLALSSGWLRLMVMRVGPTPAAYFYAFRHGATHYFYQSAFDPSWNDHSVGLVAMGLAIRSAFEEGAAEFDMLHGNERYKLLWTREARTIGRLEIHPPFFRGWITGGAAEIGRAARAMGRTLLRAPGGSPLA